jgi:hypothetical protein
MSAIIRENEVPNGMNPSPLLSSSDDAVQPRNMYEFDRTGLRGIIILGYLASTHEMKSGNVAEFRFLAGAGKGFHIFAAASEPALEPIQLSIPHVSGSFSGIKAAGA